MHEDDDHEGLTPEIRRELDALSRSEPPPEGLEERLVAELQRRGLVGRRAGEVDREPGAGAGRPAPGLPGGGSDPEARRGRPPRRAGRRRRALLLAAVLAAMAFALGVALGRWTALPATPPGGRYLLLLVEPAGMPASDDEAGRAAQIGAWARGVRAAGTEISGERLGEDRVIVGAQAAGGAAAGATSSAALVGGYFVVEAADLEDAAAVARTCPFLAWGGRIEVRPIEPT